MSELSNDAVVVESTESVEETAPKFDFEMIALRSRLNPTNPTKNVDFVVGMTLYVTEKPSNGAIRVSQSATDLEFELDSIVSFDHATRKGAYGALKIVGIVDSEGNAFGNVPNKSLSLREIV